MDIYKRTNDDTYKNKLPYFTKYKNEQGWREYNEEENRIMNQFRKDLFEHFDVENNPKKDLLFSKAWDLGHSSGYNEVALYFGDLVELIK